MKGGYCLHNMTQFRSSYYSYLLLVPAVLIMPFIFSLVTIDPVMAPRYLAWSTILTLITSLIVIQVHRESTFSSLGILRRAIFPAFIIYFFFSALSIIGSVNSGEGLLQLLRLFLSLWGLVVAAWIFDRESEAIDILSKVMILSATLLALIGILQFYRLAFGWIPGNISVYSTAYATMANKNLLGSVLFMMLPFLIYSIVRFHRSWRLVSIMALLLTQFAIILVRSRAVWVAGILSAVAVTLIVFLIIRNRPARALFSGYGKLLILVIAALLIAVVVSAMLFGHYEPAFSPWARMASIFDLESVSISQRLLMWRKSVEMIKDNLILGVGLGHWRVMLPSYGTTGMLSEAGVVHWQRPHNDFIWVLAETGLPGLIAYLSLFVIIMAYSVRIIARSEDAREKIFTALMLFGLIGYVVIACFSFPKERPMHSILLVLIMAGIVSIYHRTFPLPEWVKDKPVLPWAIPVFILLISSVVAERRQINSEVHTKRALEARENGQWSRVIEEINRAETGLSVMDPMATPLTWYRGVARFTLDDIDNARADFEKAYRVHPYHINVLNNLATCNELRGQHQLAIGYYLQALAVSPANEQVLINLGAAYYNSGRYREAYATLLKCDTTTTDARLPLYLEAVRKKLER